MPNNLFRRLPISLAVLQALAMWNTAHALPTGEAVQAGQATFQRDGNTLRINQGTNKAIVNWQSFNIQNNEAVNVFQPSHGAALFRIIGPEASQIFGSLTATGSLFLSSPNGILFAPGARVDVGSLVATTMRINNADFMSGNYRFFADPNQPDGSVVNQGVIRTTDGGYLVLLGSKVENSGMLQANHGSVVLGSAESAVLDFYGDGLVRVNLSGDALNAAIDQAGTITANGGVVQLAAHARTAALNVDGVIQANSLVERNGVIRLEGGANSTVLVSGKLEATGQDTKGGNVTVTGERVALLDAATIDVSGKTGGGEALIGGDYQGKDALVQNAERTYVASGASINADALDSGDGGKIVVWADDITRYYGSISAQALGSTGNGGFAEVSGKRLLDFNGQANLSAFNGQGGNLLLDPTNITIAATDSNTTGFTPPADLTEAFADDAGLNSIFRVNAGGSFAGIAAGSTITLQATNNITVSSTFNVATATGTANNSLVLQADNNLNINAAVSTTGTGSINLQADADGNGAGNLAIGNNITSQSGGIALSGATITRSAGNIASTGTANNDAGNISISSTGATNLGAATVTATGGTASAGNPGRNGGVITINTDGFTTTGTITASGSNGSGANMVGGNAGSVIINSTNGIAMGAVTTNGGNAGTGNANGGTGGTITVNNTTAGAISTGAISSRAGNSIGTGTSLGGSVTLSNTASGNVATGAITTSGNTNSNAYGGTIKISTSAGNISAGALTSSAGTMRAGNAGKDAGAITINSGGSFTGTTLTANGSAGNGAAGNWAGGDGAAITITAIDGVTTTTIAASGGAASTTNAGGGDAGSIAISNTGSGNIQTTTLSSQAGNATGTGAGGSAGSISVSNTAAGGDISTTTITTAGATNAHGGDATLSSLGNVTVTGTITTSGGARGTGVIDSGRNAGNVAITGVNRSVTSTITANGGAALGTNQAGGDAGAVAITGSGTLNTAAINSRNGNATGTGASGNVGSINLSGTAVTLGALTTSGSSNGDGGDVTVNATGLLTLNGAIASTGGANVPSTTQGGNHAGNVTLAGDGITTLVAASINANGGAGLGANQASGNAGTVTLTSTDTILARNINVQTGAATGTGAGGNVGSITVSGTSIATGALTTTGGSNGDGGNINVTSTSGNLSVTAVAANGGTAISGNSGRNAGTVTLNSTGSITGTTITASGSSGNGINQAGGSANNIVLTAADAITVGAITAVGGDGGTTGNSDGGNGGNITLDSGGVAPNINLGGNITVAGGRSRGTGTAGSGGTFWAKDATTNTANITVSAIGGTGGGAGGIIRFDDALNETGTARTLTLTAGTGSVTLAGGTPSNALTTLVATSTSNTLGSVQTKGTQTYNGATNLNGDLATLGTAGTDTITFNSPVTLTGNSSITTAGGAGDNITIGQTINGNFDLTLDAGAAGNVTTNAAIGGTTALDAFSATGNAVTLGRSITASSIFGQSTTGDLTLSNGGTVLTATGTGNALQLVTADQFINNVGAGVLNASNGTGRFLVWSQNPANDTRGGLVYNFKQYNATYGVTTVADSNSNNNGLLFTIAPTLNASLSGVTKIYDGTTAATLTAANYSGITGAIDGDSVVAAGLPAIGTYDNANAGVNKTVDVIGTATGTNGAATVYGYQISISGAGNTITPRPITIIANAGQSKYFGSADPIFTFTIGGMGLGAGDALSGRLGRAPGEILGSYAINQGSLALPTPENYIFTFIGNDFNILQPVSTTGLPVTTAGLVDLNPKLNAYTNSPLLILSLAPTAAGEGSEGDNQTECENKTDQIGDKESTLMLNFGLNMPKGVNNSCI